MVHFTAQLAPIRILTQYGDEFNAFPRWYMRKHVRVQHTNAGISKTRFTLIGERIAVQRKVARQMFGRVLHQIQPAVIAFVRCIGLAPNIFFLQYVFHLGEIEFRAKNIARYGNERCCTE